MSSSDPCHFECPAWPPAWPEIAVSVRETLDSGDWGRYQSPILNRLRDTIAAEHAVSQVRLCSSGSAAVEISLRAGGVGQGDEVVIAAYDYPGNFRAIEVLGAKPVLLDVAPGQLSLDPAQLEAAASSSVAAVIVSHLYGQPADVKSISEVCRSHDWVMIEDACQVPGMKIDDVPVGCFGDIATLSFGGSKPLTAGCGGAVLTNSDRFSAKISAFLDRPSDSQPLSSLQAAALLPQLERLETCNQMRRATINFLKAEVESSLPWKIMDRDHGASQAHYKLAFVAESSQHAQAVISKSTDFGLPIGAGFRSMHRSSERRCRKPVALEHAKQLAERIFVLDHAALLLPHDRHQELAVALQELAGSA